MFLFICFLVILGSVGVLCWISFDNRRMWKSSQEARRQLREMKEEQKEERKRNPHRSYPPDYL
jgi:hypothetical protein